MTPGSGSVSTVLSFGKEGFYIRQIPMAAALLMLGLFVLLNEGPDKPVAAPYILIAAGGGFIAFALWRRLNPGEPVLVLSPHGVRYRFMKSHVIVIPWDDVQGVESTDIKFFNRGFVSTERGVPVVLVTGEFYRKHIHLDSLWRRGPGWNYQFIPKGDMVQVAFVPSVFSQTPSDLRAAIETRWRAFSKNPHAKAPPAPSPADPGVWLSDKQKFVLAISAMIASAPLLWHWQWGAAWLQSDVSEGSRQFYAERLLQGPGLPARDANGDVIHVSRTDGTQIEATQCRKQIVRDAAAQGALPAYEAAWRCVANLRLANGEHAIGAFRLIVERYGLQYPHGDYRRGSALAAASVSAEEAEAIVREMGARP